MTDDHIVDATGLLCPLPVLKLRKALMAAAPGTSVTLVTDDPAAVIDVPHFCNEAGHILTKQNTDSAPYRFTVKR
ncbi:MAG: sulfurtransferase TusA family protein, partial [Pseudomonadota bacterium]